MTDKVWKIVDSHGNRAENSKIYTTERGAHSGFRSFIDRKLQSEYLQDEDLDYGAYCVYISSKSKSNPDWHTYMTGAAQCTQESIDAAHIRWEELNTEFTVQEATIT